MVTQASQWQSKKQPDDTIELDLPSGNTCLARRIAPETFLDSGMIPDPIMPLMQKSIHLKKGLPPQEMKKLEQDPKKLVAAIQMFDRVLVYAVVEPRVELPPACECGKREADVIHLDSDTDGFHAYRQSEERKEDALYADVVDLEDKMYIFQWCLGGASDIAQFRDKLPAGVVSSPTG